MCLETVVPTSAWQCSPLSKSLTRILVYVTVDCYRTETPQTNLSFFSSTPGTLIELEQSLFIEHIVWEEKEGNEEPLILGHMVTHVTEQQLC